MRKKKYLSIIIISVAVIILAIAIAFFARNSEKITAAQNTTTAKTTATATVPAVTEKAADPNDDLLILVNHNYPIPDNYKPNLVQTEWLGQKIDKRAAKPLKQLVAACRKAGYKPLPCSGYRSKSEQSQILNDKIRENQNLGYSKADAAKEARKWITEPGKSEHHTGLAMDIIDLDYQILDEKQAKTGTQKWLMANCWKYGFILRYPADKKDITHIDSESWHYRYVGKEHAKKMHDLGLCLEEYVGKAG